MLPHKHDWGLGRHPAGLFFLRPAATCLTHASLFFHRGLFGSNGT